MASHSILPKKLFRRLSAQHKTHMLPNPIKFRTANGSFVAKRHMRVPTRLHLQRMTKPLVIHEDMIESGSEDDTTIIGFNTLVTTGLLKSLAEHF